MSPSEKLNKLQASLRKEVDAAVSSGVLDADERERIYEQLQALMDEVWADKKIDAEEREVVWDLYETCLVKLRTMSRKEE